MVDLYKILHLIARGCQVLAFFIFFVGGPFVRIEIQTCAGVSFLVWHVVALWAADKAYQAAMRLPEGDCTRYPYQRRKPADSKAEGS